MQHPTDRITHTTTFVTPVVEDWLEQEIAIKKPIRGMLKLVLTRRGDKCYKERQTVGRVRNVKRVRHKCLKWKAVCTI